MPPEWREKGVDAADTDVPRELVENMQPGEEPYVSLHFMGSEEYAAAK